VSLPRVEWTPSPNHWAGRNGQPIRGWVLHRMVGWLAGTDRLFADSARQASTHFGIGHDGIGELCPQCGHLTGARGTLRIHQYVDLANSAWGNGDVRDPTWGVARSLPSVNPNLYTVNTEHEDGGEAGRGIVTDHVWDASVELMRLVTSGSIDRIRQAGVVVSNVATVQQLAAIPRDASGFVDHNQISGPNKPYCWRPWQADAGFVPGRRPSLLAALNEVTGTMAPPLQFKPEEWTVSKDAPFWIDGPGGPQDGTFAGGEAVSVAESKDGLYRLVLAGEAPDAVWVARKSMTPKTPGGDAAYVAAVTAALNREATGTVTEVEAKGRVGVAARAVADAGKAALDTEAARFTA
jgi:hypothetical protein